jgi:hypothetical protein
MLIRTAECVHLCELSIYNSDSLVLLVAYLHGGEPRLSPHDVFRGRPKVQIAPILTITTCNLPLETIR